MISTTSNKRGMTIWLGYSQAIKKHIPAPMHVILFKCPQLSDNGTFTPKLNFVTHILVQ